MTTMHDHGADATSRRDSIRSIRAVSPDKVLLEADHVTQNFTSDKGTVLTVLDDVSFTLYEGEVVAILGRSGAGKSTLLRVLAGLVEPTSGSVSYRSTRLNGPNPGVSFVFQTFALMPWLTVQANVELGLQARGVSRRDRAKLALAAIDSIGLDGFEGAYPKELSGGMRQRVGIARALVLHPDALFMDEPFSALDVLTAENLRQEVLRLFSSADCDIKSMLIVTHNIEEAVQMADRIVVLSSNPGRAAASITVDLPRPRDRHDPRFDETVNRLYSILTGGPAEPPEHAKNGDEKSPATTSEQPDKPQPDEQQGAKKPATQQPPQRRDLGRSPTTVSQTATSASESGTTAPASDATASTTQRRATTASTAAPLPDATPAGISGLLDVLMDHPQGVSLADLASDLSFEVDDLFPLVDAGALLGVMEVHGGRLRATNLGMRWCEADILTSKQMFARMAIDKVPLVRSIDTALRKSRSGRLHGELIVDLLRARYGDADARRQFATAVGWGRYGELFDYDADDDILTLDDANLDGQVADGEWSFDDENAEDAEGGNDSGDYGGTAQRG